MRYFVDKAHYINRIDKIRTMRIFLLLFVLLLPFCERKTKDSISIDEFCQKFVDLYQRFWQKWFYECNESAHIVSFDLPQEVDQAREACLATISELKKAISRDTIEFDGKKAFSYFRNLENLISKNCQEIMRKSVLVEINENFAYLFSRDVFVGKLVEGQECYINNECAEGFYCGGKGCPGTCVPLGKLGDPCRSNEECSPELVCFSQSCTLPSFKPCRRSSDCPYPQKCVGGQCTLFKEKGQDCEKDEECDYTCNFEEKKCVDFKFVDYGKPCGEINGDLVRCLKGSCSANPENPNELICQPYSREGENCSGGRVCDIGLFCSESGVCQKIPQEGQSCKLFCAWGFYCQDGVCRKLKNTGEVCIDNRECKTSVCVEGRCADPRANAGFCNEDSDCINFNCLNNVCCTGP